MAERNSGTPYRGVWKSDVMSPTGAKQQNRSPTRIVRALRHGQVTIPAEFRRRLGIDDDSLLLVTLANGELRMKPLRTADRAQRLASPPWLKELYEQFASVRAAAATHSEDEINADIDQAIAEVRRAHA
jgi:bifunctional DNA-binding transcriptional regulator/antitoxin component of YhaV-PrlF toxin-antitoxin module